MSRQSPSDITVIIPCYNDGNYIEQALQSILDQTLLPKEIIIIDDGSDQLTLDILKRLTHPNLQIIFQENRGVCHARNRGIALAKTEFILTLDADDLFKPTFIEKAFKLIYTSADVAAVCSYYQGFNKDKMVTDIIKPLGGGVSNFLVKNNGVASALFRKICWEQVSGYDTNFDKGYEDWDFWISILKNNWKMHVIPETLFKYRIKDTSRDQMAVAFYDKQLRTAIYNKHKSVYLEHSDRVFSELIYKNGRLIHKVMKVQDTIDYRLGKTLLKPLRFVKNLFS
jgi:glycosyltransferase involved in cell wall biosynthesis